MLRQQVSIVKHVYYSNWGDNVGYPLAAWLLPIVTKVPFLTPNVVTILAFFLYTIGSVSLFLVYPYHLLAAAILLPLGFLGDDLDGQIARARNLSSAIGDFLDKVLDVVKIFILTASLSFAVYVQTSNALSLLFGFIAGFFFMLRYYIKLETLFSQVSKRADYLDTSSAKRQELEKAIDALYKKKNKTVNQYLHVLWHKHRTVLFVDEAEFALFTAIGALLNKLELVLWVLAASQVVWASFRILERGRQVATSSERLLWPLRK